MELLKGIAVSPGIIVGKVFVVDEERRRIPRRAIPKEQIPREHDRLWKALGGAIAELNALAAQTRDNFGREPADIFLVHVRMLSDAALTRPMHEVIDKELTTAEYGVWKAFEDLIERFEKLPDPTFKTKIDDLRDLSARVLRQLIGEHASRLSAIDREAVVIAPDLTPSQTAAFNRQHVLAFATELGGKTSHTAIFARALGIPAVVGVGRIIDLASDGQTVIIDGDRGFIILDPDQHTLDEYRSYSEARKTLRLSLTELARLPAVTTDGKAIQIVANIEFPSEIPNVFELGGEGVGLYRTEYLYLTSDKEPTEDDHFQAYRQAVEFSKGKLLTIRTVDLGADKYTQQRTENPERNPFLGLRSIRYCLQNLGMFKVQLRALLRASAFGPIKIMFPLITTTSEFRQARMLLNDVMEDLEEEGVPFDRAIEVGMMVEVPASAIMANIFAREAAFFSIGTNDLVQYTLAVDRTNEKVANLYAPCHPAVVKMIRDVIRAGRHYQIPVSCCGESAGDPEYALLLIGLGLRTLSVTSSSIPVLKRLIRSVSLTQCERLAKKASTLDSDAAILAFLRDRARKIIPEAFDGRSDDH